MPTDADEHALRDQLYQDLSDYLDRDVATSGYMASFLARVCPLELVERLVDELDSIYTPRTR